MLQENKFVINYNFTKPYQIFATKRKRYKIVKGSRASLKSTNAAAYCLLKILSNDKSNVVAIRQSYNNIQGSIYNLFKKVAREYLKVYDLFEWRRSPLKVIKKSTGQSIVFRGLTDPEKIAGIEADIGYFDTVWIDEAYEIRSHADWNKVEGTFRGIESPEIEFILTYNPWMKNWLYEEFFKGRLEDEPEVLEAQGWQQYESENMLLLITNHRINPYLTDEDHWSYLKHKFTHPNIYKVASLGCNGALDEIVYNTFSETNIVTHKLVSELKFERVFVGIDFALANDATAISIGGITTWKGKRCSITFDEWSFSNSGRTNKKGLNDIVYSVILKLREFLENYPAFKRDRVVYVENQEGGGFKAALKAAAKNEDLTFYFYDSKKPKITERVIIYRFLHGEELMLYSNKCQKTIYEFRNASYSLDKLRKNGILVREDGSDDLINANEYAHSGVWNLLVGWYTGIKGSDAYGFLNLNKDSLWISPRNRKNRL